MQRLASTQLAISPNIEVDIKVLQTRMISKIINDYKLLNPYPAYYLYQNSIWHDSCRNIFQNVLGYLRFNILNSIYRFYGLSFPSAGDIN